MQNSKSAILRSGKSDKNRQGCAGEDAGHISNSREEFRV